MAVIVVRFVGAALVVSTIALASWSCGVAAPAKAPSLVQDSQGHSLSDLPPVFQLSIRATAYPIEPSEVWLVSGEVSAASRAALRRSEIPATLEARRQALSVWRGPQQLLVSPGEVLQAGGAYALVAVGVGLLAELHVTERAHSVYYRFGTDEVEPGQLVVYCDTPPPRLETGLQRPTESNPASRASQAELPERLAWGINGQEMGAEHCLRYLVPSAAAGFVVPPPGWESSVIQPQPLFLREPNNDRDEGAATDELAAHLAGEPTCSQAHCVRVDGPSAIFTLPRGVFALSTSDQAGRRLVLVQSEVPGEEQVGPLSPADSVDIEIAQIEPYRPDLISQGSEQGVPPVAGVAGALGETIDELPGFVVAKSQLTTGPAEAKFVLNEALGDPEGPEPSSEWVEVVNAGNGEGSLFGYFIGDDAGEVALPDVVLQPGEYGLIVRSDFVFDVDHEPHRSSHRIQVQRLGENGIRNSGEVVSLLAGDGRVVSRMPSFKTRAGVSLARRSLWASDEAGSFAPHAPPGASPGAANSFERAGSLTE